MSTLLIQTISKMDRAEVERKQERERLTKDNVEPKEAMISINSQKTPGEWQNLSVRVNDNIRVLTPSTDRAILGDGTLRSMD